jgi:hypothetical protein
MPKPEPTQGSVAEAQTLRARFDTVATPPRGHAADIARVTWVAILANAMSCSMEIRELREKQRVCRAADGENCCDQAPL